MDKLNSWWRERAALEARIAELEVRNSATKANYEEAANTCADYEQEIGRLRGIIGERDVRLDLLLTVAQSARFFIAQSPEQHKELSKSYKELEWAVSKYFEQCPDGRPALKERSDEQEIERLRFMVEFLGGNPDAKPAEFDGDDPDHEPENSMCACSMCIKQGWADKAALGGEK